MSISSVKSVVVNEKEIRAIVFKEINCLPNFILNKMISFSHCTTKIHGVTELIMTTFDYY